VYKDLLQLFQFLGTSVFPAPHGAAVFPLWWEALAVVVVEQVLKPCIPDEETGLIAFSQTVAPATLAFEDEMIKLGISPPSFFFFLLLISSCRFLHRG